MIIMLGGVTGVAAGEVTGLGGLLTAVVSLVLILRQRSSQARESMRLREALEQAQEKAQQECLRQIQTIGEDLAASEKTAQASLEMLRDGRLGMPARARALRMLRSGMAADTAATELGLGKNEVRLLAKVSGLLAPLS